MVPTAVEIESNRNGPTCDLVSVVFAPFGHNKMIAGHQ